VKHNHSIRTFVEMKYPKLHILSFVFFFLVSLFTMAQEEVKIELGKKNLLPDETFTIKVTIKNRIESKVGQFPEIQGFTKGARQVSHPQSAGNKIITHIITQTYTPTRDGIYRLSPFSIEVNGENYESEGAMISVAKSGEESDNTDETPVIVNTKEDAYLSIVIDKKQVYVGEGFRVSLVLYVAETNTAAMGFTDINNQINAIAKKIKPSDCLEERLTITDIPKVQVTINNKKYTSYELFEAHYYPLNNKPISFPSVELKMDKFATDSKGIVDKSQKNIIGFVSKPYIIQVIDLPDHPLKDKVSVGEFYSSENIETRRISTGKSFNYIFKIVGNGNIATITMPNLQNDSHFDFYPPEIKETKTIGKVEGEKEFRYRIIPKDSGQHTLEKYISWVYFNTKKKNYDTLHSKIKVLVSGKTIEDNSGGTGDIYDGLDKIDTSIIQADYRQAIKNVSNVLLILMLFGMIYVFIKPNRKAP
jgi:hypothetical protein